MLEVREIIELKDYGKIEITLKNLMDKYNLNIYQMAKLTNLKYSTIKSYYNNDNLTRVDMDVIAKMCYVLNCEVSDILKYIK